MAELPDRMEIEARVAKELAKLLRAEHGQILEVLGDPPNLANLTEEMWVAFGDDMFLASNRHFQDIYLRAAQHILDTQPIGVDWGLINQGAARWAREASFELVRGITATSRRAVQEAVGSFFEQQLTMRDLRNMLSQTFGPVRADMIASTEVTRAAVQGEFAFVEELRKEGVELRARWITNNDAIVQECPICWPLHEKLEDVWQNTAPAGPPAHVRCRCWINHEFVGSRETIGG